MIFNETRLLDCVAYGSEFAQEFNTRITTLRSGVERRNADWDAPLGRYSVRYQNLRAADHQLVMHAHWASMGALIPFRFKDWTDFTAADEPFGVATGDVQELQLIKSYAFGPVSYERRITKPVGPVTIFAAGLATPATIDYATGLVTLTAAAGSVLTWSGEFDVPVRFMSDRLDASPAAPDGPSFFVLSSDVDLIEVRDA